MSLRFTRFTVARLHGRGDDKHCMLLYYANWMSGVADCTPIAQSSIPGSHESCALYGGGSTQCQSLTIRQQLDNGVRFLDVR